ncbi:MAG TPA: DUF1326 domain-containing protein [Solirubrobacterales bacterium]|nr:DUF1326 domain-containing protein [Solirubrobacterales bacterium]
MSTNGATQWRIAGDEVGSCNCIWACPCQFDADPSEGNCHAVIAFHVREGNYGNTRLDDVKFAEIVSWPGAIHEGDGTVQAIVDEAATEEQREALLQIASGQNGGEYFEIFASVLPHVREPLVAAIEIESDRERRVAQIRIGDVAEATIEPIKNPITGDEHRVRIDLPDGFEYKQAEIGNTVSARSSGEAPLEFTLEGTYAQLNPFDFSNSN